MTQVQVAVSLAAFGFAPRPGTAVVIEQTTGERVGSLDCPACHGTFSLALPEQAS